MSQAVVFQSIGVRLISSGFLFRKSLINSRWVKYGEVFEKKLRSFCHDFVFFAVLVVIDLTLHDSVHCFPRAVISVAQQ